MIRGIYLGRPLISGAITMTIFTCRALSMYTMNPIIEIMTTPIVVFILFLIAGLVITYPCLKSWRAFVIAPLLVIVIIFFTYTYYIL